jgi:integrase
MSTKRRTKTKATGVYKSSSGRYEISFRDSSGKLRSQVVDGGFEDAKNERAAIVARMAQGERVAPTSLTLGGFADEWIRRQEGRVRPTTHTLYATYLRLHVQPRLGRRRLQAITVDDVAALIVSMQNGTRFVQRDGRVVQETGKPFAAWTVRGVLVVLGRLFASAVREGLIPSNPVTKLERGERPKTERREFPSLDREAVQKLIAATPTRYRTLVALSLLTGLRQSEALALRWQDVDTKAGVVQVRWQLSRRGELVEPKTKAARREVPIPPSLGKALAAHQLASRYSKPTDYVFASETGGPLHYRNIVRRGLDKAIEETGLPHLTWHDLRHVAASALIAQGCSVAYLSRLLGHASPSITLSTYAHEFASAEHADRTRDQMEQALGGLLS